MVRDEDAEDGVDRVDVVDVVDVVVEVDVVAGTEHEPSSGPPGVADA